MPTRQVIDDRLSPLHNPQDYVLRTRIPAKRLPGTPRYGDAEWRLDELARMQTEPRRSLRFDTIPPPFRGVVRELFAVLLLGSQVKAPRFTSAGSIRSVFSEAKQFTEFLASKGVSGFQEVDSHVLATYYGLRANGDTPTHRQMQIVEMFFDYESHLSEPLTFDPRTLYFWVRAPKRPGENSTPRIPEEVLKPLVWWSARIIDTLAEDILAARADYLDLIARQKVGIGKFDPTRPTARVRALLDEYERSGRPLPGHRTENRSRYGVVNGMHIDRLAGAGWNTRIANRSFRARLDALAESNGVEADSYLRFEPEARLDGIPWHGRIPFDEVPDLVTVLQMAAYVCIAYFSGMRESEVTHLQKGCLIRDRDTSGELTIRRVRSRAFKGNDLPTGKEESWVVPEIAAKAVDVLERIPRNKVGYLFEPCYEGSSARRSGDGKPMTNHATLGGLEFLMEWVNDLSARLGIDRDIPRVNGETWRLTTRQFRRTLAWFIARHPGGLAAGALQYKHVSLGIFRGYAGTSESGFAEEVATEQALARGEWLNTFALEVDGAIGRATGEASKRLQDFVRNLRFAGKLPENPAQLARILRRHDPHVYRGTMVTCVFDPVKALCLRARKDEPDLQACQPLKCANAIFSPDDVAAWKARAEDLLALGRDGSMAPFIRSRARDSGEKLQRFFAQLDREKSDD